MTKKPNTYADVPGYRPTLSCLMACYGNIVRQNPNAWLHGITFEPSELLDFPDIAHALGYELETISKPVIVNFEQPIAA